MRERVLAIVNLIAQYVLGADDIPISEQELRMELTAVGFDTEEIDDAFSWMEKIALQPQTNPPATELIVDRPTYRIFSAEEEQLLTTEARGFLVKVQTMGLLSAAALEEVIDRATRTVEDRVSEQEIKMITILTLLSRSNTLWLREIDCFLEDDWKRIYH